MDERTLARAVVDRGLATADQVRSLLDRQRQGDARPLGELLVASGVLSRDQLARFERASGRLSSESQRVPSSRVPTVADPGSSPPLAVGAAAADPTLDAERARVTEALRRILERDPLFSPIPEIAIENERVLGEGGMGIVRLVRDRRLGRMAALKLIKGDAKDSSIKRFLREAAITARLDHPGIPPVYEAGRISTGQHFMLLRFIDGASLDDIIQKARKKRHDLLSILVKVGEAVAYAHSRKIVHRDLKPANVMVGAFGEVLVMDWGLARDLGESTSDDEAVRAMGATRIPVDTQKPGLTRQGAIMGTLGWMPPEQARGEDVDERADVFALGAMLSVILTGKPPFDAGDSDIALLAAAVEGRIVTPRERDRWIAPELDAIAAKALAPDKALRYPTARAFTDDVRAFLEGRDVSVYRYKASDQAVRLVKRHPAFFASIGVFIVLASAGVVVLGLKNVQIQRASAEIAKKSDELAKKNDELVAKSAEIERASAELRTKNDEIEKKNEEQRAIIAALEREKNERAAAEKGRATAEQERATAEKAREAVVGASDLLVKARTRLRQGAERAEVEKLVNDAVASLRNEATLLDAGRLLVEAGDPDEANKLLRACADEFPPGYGALWSLHQIAHGQSDSPFKLSEPLKELVERAKQRGDQSVYAQLAIATDAAAKNDWATAAVAADKAIELAPRLAAAWVLRAEVRAQIGQPDGALDDAAKALSIEPDPFAFDARGAARLQKGDLDGALSDFDRAIAGCDRFAVFWSNRCAARLSLGDADGAIADASKAIELQPTMSLFWSNRSIAKMSKGDLAGALADVDKSVELDAVTANPHIARAIVLMAMSRLDEALAAADRAVAITPPVARALVTRARIHNARGSLDLAIADARRAAELDPKYFDPPSLLGAFLTAKGQLDEALAEFSKGLALRPNYAPALCDRGRARQLKGDLDGAYEDFTKATELMPKFGTAWVNRAYLRQLRKDLDGAISDVTRAIEAQPNLAGAWCDRGYFRSVKGDLDGAISDTTRAIDLDSKLVLAYRNRVEFRAEKGDWDGAIADAQKATELAPRSAAAWSSLGYCRTHKGDAAAALQALDKAIELDAKHAFAWNNRAEARLKKGDLKGAEQDVARSLELDGKNAWAYKNRGLVKAAKKDRAGAIKDYDKAIELDAKCYDAWKLRGFARADAGEVAGATADLDRFLELSHDESENAAVKKKLDALSRRR